jgi:N-acetyl-S-(2-succino)cysteine monooxygenase
MMSLITFPQLSGNHLSAWRHPQSWTNTVMDLDKYLEIAEMAERAKFDLIFLADGNSVPLMGNPEMFAATTPQAVPAVFEPTTLLSALAMVTKDIGLVATATTTYEAPYMIARKFGSLDHLSRGRAGWNIVTTAWPADSLNFGYEDHLAKDVRYERASEFVDVVKGLWDSWAEDAFVEDKATGRYLDPERVHTLDHKGKYLSVKGPLNMKRLPQGYPVLFSAGQSEDGRELAASVSDCNFVAVNSKAHAQALTADIKGRMHRYGRTPDMLKIFPALNLYIAPTRDEAQEMYDQLNEMILPSFGVASLSQFVGIDLSQYPIDGPMPPIEFDALGVEGTRKAIKDLVESEDLTIRQAYKRILGYANQVVIGNPTDAADVMEDWYLSGACDGFMLNGPSLPVGFRNIAELVVPELQRRGLFRTEYTGKTLRENMGLPTPANQFFS